MNILYSLVLSIALQGNDGIQVHDYVVDYNLSIEDCEFYLENHNNKSLSCKPQVN
jgi:hypothetical protein